MYAAVVNFEYDPAQVDYDNDIDYNCTFSVLSDHWGDYLSYQFDSWQPIGKSMSCKDYSECGNSVYIKLARKVEQFYLYYMTRDWIIHYTVINITIRITIPEHTEIRMKFFTQLKGESCESDEFRCDHGCLHRSLACGQDGESYCPDVYKTCNKDTKVRDIVIIAAAIVAFVILVVVIVIYIRGNKLNIQACCLSSTRRSTDTSENAMTVSATQLASQGASATSNENTENQIPSLAFPPSECGSVADIDAAERHYSPQCDLPPSYDEATRKRVQ